MNFTNIPKELKENGYFCVWNYEQDKKGRKTKVPYNAKTGGRAKTNDITTFTNFEDAMSTVETYTGIGLGIFEGIGAIDIDHCVEDGIITEMAQDIINIMNAYTEYSPSGEGIRILFKADSYNYDKAVHYIHKPSMGLEVYVAGATYKYVTVTGDMISAGTYGERSAELQIVLNKYMKRKQSKKTDKPIENQSQDIVRLSDSDVLDKARSAKNGEKFNALYSGDISAYPSHSEADYALCNMLAFWCRCDSLQIDRIFRNSGLYREKWNREQAGTTYGRNMIDRVINNCTEVYHPSSSHSKNSLTLMPTDFTDIGQAKVFSQEYQKTLCFSRATKWLYYTGRVWEEDETKVHELTQTLTDSQLTEAIVELTRAKEEMEIAKKSDDKEKVKAASKALQVAQEYHKFALGRRNSGKISSAQKESQPMLAIKVKELDSDGFKMNTITGTVDLKTSELLSHNPDDYCTKITATGLSDEGADLFSDLLNIITCGDKALEDYLQLIAGMCSLGTVFRENLVIAYGSGRNGKSTFFNLLARVMGDYSGHLSAETLTVNCRKNKSPEYAELRGKRLVIAAELEEGMRLDTAIVKKLCSTDPILAEKKYKDPFSFIPSHTVVLYTNHLPKVGTSDDGTWRRLIVIPFNAVIDGKSDKKNYADYLFRNAGGAVLKWVIEGARKFIAAEYKIVEPECVKQAIDCYRNDNDWISNYIDECCVEDDLHMQKARELYENYRNYCSRIGDYPRSNADFKKALENAGFEHKGTNKGAFYRGLRLMQESELNSEIDSSCDTLMPYTSRTIKSGGE